MKQPRKGQEFLRKLNIGCGQQKLEGFTNIDINSAFNPDILMDAGQIPNYKQFKNNTISEIRSSHFLEHTENPEEIMREWHRILSVNGILKIKLPHFSRGFTNPDHKRGFDLSWPLHFDKENSYSTYAGVEYEVEKMKMVWIAFLDHYPAGPLTKRFLSLANKIINSLASLSPYFCSRVWCFWVGGFEEMEIWFKKKSTIS
jgi:predicted SAM-dependent methyltransferase